MIQNFSIREDGTENNSTLVSSFTRKKTQQNLSENMNVQQTNEGVKYNDRLMW